MLQFQIDKHSMHRQLLRCSAAQWSRRMVVDQRLMSTALLNWRLGIWNREEKEQEERRKELEANPATNFTIPIIVRGTKRDIVTQTTTPLDLARKYDQKRAKRYIVAVINGTTMWDMQRTLPENTEKVEFLKYDEEDPRVTEVFWHSSAHVLGAALEKIYGDNVLLCDGPALPEGGFFYDFLLLKDDAQAKTRMSKYNTYQEVIDKLCGPDVSLEDSLRFLSVDNLPHIQKVVTDIAKDKHVFRRMDVSYDFARELFRDNPFKLHFIDHARQNAADPTSGTVSLYRCGNMVDLCRGPHAFHSTQIQAFWINKVSSAHWMGHLDGQSQQKAPVLNRVYGISFPQHPMMRDYRLKLDRAAKRDHRRIGKEQKLFMMHSWAPGSGFILPHGVRMVNTIMSAIRRKYAEYGFDEVSTPLMYNRKLWETSGHWENYRDDMFTISDRNSSRCCDHHSNSSSNSSGSDTADEPEFGLKPMNCPGHCLIFASDQRSYKDLPIRYADFSPLHRNEIAGALSGLTRVRKFHQDDGHIFCTHEQIQQEIGSCLRLIDEIYQMLGFANYELALSTRPQTNYIGTLEEWEQAELALKTALEFSERPWTLNEGDGAFYGPKIDVRVEDALGRKHQTATIQLDFQLPQRFELKYIGSDGQQHQPVMIHRAVLGSMERMLAILIEHWGGKWPFWINPRQAIVVPTTVASSAPEITKYAQKVRDILAGDKDPKSVDNRRFFVDVDISGNTLNRAVRDAQLAQYSYILVVGEKEVEGGTVDVRKRNGNKRLGSMAIADVRSMFQFETETFK